MFNTHRSSKTNMIKRMEAHKLIPKITHIVTSFKEENVKETNRILTAFSEIGELPKALSDIKLDIDFLHHPDNLLDAFLSLRQVGIFLALREETTETIKSRLITRYPWNTGNVLFNRLFMAGIVPDSEVSLLRFYFNRTDTVEG